ncbi:MAG: transketolase [Vampirovibrionia bacterium]
MVNNNNLDQLCVNTIRTLSMDAVQKAKSGHPGMPMGMAAAAYTLWTKHLKHNPENPDWINRDRFVLSAGHGSMLLYSLLYLSGYGLTIEDIKYFRQLDSKTPGHPEIEMTKGVETSTGPLGQGFANGIGMAIAQKHLAAKYNKSDYNIFDYKIYGIVGDGDLMEGISYEAAALAGHLKLGNIIYLFDNNSVTIEGKTNLATSEDMTKRFEACGWQILHVDDGNNIEAISNAIQLAKNETTKPSIIAVKTLIGYGSPNKQGTSGCHGSPLGDEEIVLTKKNLNWPEPEKSFFVPEEALNKYRSSIESGKKSENEWDTLFNTYKSTHPELYKEIEELINDTLTVNWGKALPDFSETKAISTRQASGVTLNNMAPHVQSLIGGSADLSPSNNTYLKGITDFSSDSYEGRNFHFGVREHSMAAMCNGISLTKGLIPYCATFLVFSDYMRNAIRLSALMKKQVVYVLTHDSIAVGEDGPTHQPVEHIASLRAIPGLVVIRPADANETKQAWQVALESKNNPTALILSRQNLPVLDEKALNTKIEVNKGAYILTNSKKATPDCIIIATGSEISIALEAKKSLEKDNIDTRIVSMPSWELFEKQSEDYKESILPKKVSKRIIIEAGISMGWEKYAGIEGKIIAINTFGESAPGDLLMAKYGFTSENIVNIVKNMLISV